LVALVALEALAALVVLAALVALAATARRSFPQTAIRGNTIRSTGAGLPTRIGPQQIALVELPGVTLLLGARQVRGSKSAGRAEALAAIGRLVERGWPTALGVVPGLAIVRPVAPGSAIELREVQVAAGWEAGPIASVRGICRAPGAGIGMPSAVEAEDLMARVLGAVPAAGCRVSAVAVAEASAEAVAGVVAVADAGNNSSAHM
jgi:hypothetical protein